MTKRISLLIALVLVVAIFAFNVSAKVMPTDPRLERINALKASFEKKAAPLDNGVSNGRESTARPARLGSVAAGPDSKGALVANTWRDFLTNGNMNRTVAVEPVGNSYGTGVQFSYPFKASSAASDRAKWGWNGWDAVVGSFAVIGGKAIVQSTAPSSPEAGSYPKIMIYPKNGKGIEGSYDFPDQANSPDFMQMHLAFEGVAFSGNFGSITGGSIMADSLNKYGNVAAPTYNTIWPALGMTVTATDTVLYMFGFEATGTSDPLGACKVFRHASTVKGNPDNLWTLVYLDTTWRPTTDFSASHVSTKVAAVWVAQSPAGLISGNTSDCDIYYADSPTGLSGSWTKHNITNYTGAGYRAWLECNSLYDSADKLHIIWNGGVTDGATFGSRSCRLFHWSEYNTATLTTVYSAQYAAVDLPCLGGYNVMNLGNYSIGECDGRLYTVFSAWNDPNLETVNDSDCASDASASFGGNGEVYVTVSKDLTGVSWDKPRNLSNSYSPKCDTSGNCADDRYASISERGIDNNVQPGSWPTDARYDPSGSYAGTSYTQVFYETDRYPGSVLGTSPNGPPTNNDMRWIRLACVPPVVQAILATTPGNIGFPAYTKPTHQKDTTILLENVGNTTLNFTSIVATGDSCKGPGCVTGWLGYTGITGTASIPEAGSTTMTLQLNKSGVIVNTTAPHRLWGRIVFNYGLPAASLTLPVSLTIADSVADTKFDTLTTATTIKLVVANNGNMGNNYADSVNMNFNPTIECDTGANMRGDAWIYLGDASPVVVRKVGAGAARASWSIFSQGYTNVNGLKPLPPGTPSNALHGNAPLHTNTANYQSYFSGTFVTVDSLLKIEKTWYAPLTSVDSADFIVQKMRVWPAKQGTAVTNVAIGEAYDWDIPADSGSHNYGNFDATRRLVYQQGYDAPDTVSTNGHDCWNNALRYGGTALIYMTNQKFIDVDSIANNYTTDSLYGGYTARNDSFVYPASGFVPEQLWTNMQTTGYFNQDGTTTHTDRHTVLTFRNLPSTGFSFPAQNRDTFTVYTVMGVVRDAATPAAGLDALKSVIDKGKAWAHKYVTNKVFVGGGCCVGQRGNVNMLGIVDLADLSALVSALTGGGFVIPCPDAANVNGLGIIDLADLSALVSSLTGGGFVRPPCP